MKLRYLFALFTYFLFNCQKEKPAKTYLLQEISSQHTAVNFVNKLTEDENHSIINYIYYYNGGGVATGDVNNDQLPDLFFVSNLGENKLYINKGNFVFEDVSKSAGISGNSDWNSGVTMVDINADGFLDIYVCAVSGLLDFEGQNELFINNGDGTFTEQAHKYGLDFKGYATQSYFFDYDKDDDLDVYIVNQAVHTTLSHGAASQRNKRTPKVGDVLLQNNGGIFKDVSEQAQIFGGPNGYGLSASIADFNNDGWDDIYVCNDFHEDDYFYINNQNGGFVESLDSYFSTISRFSMGSDAADINGDGHQDLITLDMLPNQERIVKETEGDDAMYNLQERLKKLGYKDQFSRNMLQFNSGAGYFEEAAFLNGIADTDWSWAPLVADYNNDGHLDIYITNGILRRPNDLDFKKYIASTFKNKGVNEGVKWLYNAIDDMPSGIVSDQIFKGNSSQLSEKTGDWIKDNPSLSNGAVYVDLDLDGDLDVVVNSLNDQARILKNNTKNKNYLSVALEYKNKNTEGIGTKVILYSNNKSQIKQLFKSRGFLSSVEAKLHFGLDSLNKIDSLKVIWPNFDAQTIINPNINQDIVVKYKSETKLSQDISSKTKRIFLKKEILDFTHKEDSYNDFNNEKLIPYKVSNIGPAIAIGDIDQNGFEDVFIGNSSGKKAVMYLNDGYQLSKIEIPQIEKDFLSEDNTAVFFDADNDGDLDLYVGSGTCFLKRNKPQNDRLYINNNGVFEKSIDQIPQNISITSSISTADFDNDGDQDLFVGNLSNSRAFGSETYSYLLINDGNGYFKKDPNFQIKGMVTDSKWQDINGDQELDLLVSMEWENPKIYLNKGGKLSAVNIPNQLNGLWQTITAFDIDKDGDQDILLGNWGLNTKFNASPEEPLKMFYNDFDANGVKETVVAYNIGGEYYPIYSKGEMATQMNRINKAFVKHKDYAGKTIEEILGEKVVANATIFSVDNLASGYLINDNNTAYGTFTAFDNELQLAPINSFESVKLENTPTILVSGNSLRVNTYHGAYTALKGHFLFSKTHHLPVSHFGIAPFNQQIKCTTSLEMASKNILLVLSNNSKLMTYEYQNNETL